MQDNNLEFSTGYWDNLGYDGRAYVTRICSGRIGGRGANRGGRNTGDNPRGVNESTTTDIPPNKQGSEPGREERGARNGARFRGGGY